VYRHDKHLISLTEMPAEVHLGLARTPRTIKGYNVVHWTENGMSYWAISDLAAAKLEDFVRLFRATPAEL
jgi:anti-sigma factor RsiW